MRTAKPCFKKCHLVVDVRHIGGSRQNSLVVHSRVEPYQNNCEDGGHGVWRLADKIC